MLSSINVKNEYQKDSQLKEEDVKRLMEWVAKQPHLPRITELQAILFLHSCFYSIEKAKSTIDTFFTFRTICPDLFSKRIPTEPSVQNALNVAIIAPMKKLTPEGYVVAYCRLINYDPDKFNFAHQIRNMDMAAMALLNTHGTVNGFVAIIDMDGAVFGHLLKINLMTMKKTLIYLQEAMPVRIKGIHFINVVSFVDKVLALMKPFMKKELHDIIHLHSNNLETLYKFVPQECLPQECGGQGATFSELQDECKRTISDNAELFRFEEEQTVDESKRPGKARNACDYGLEGSFKKLQVD